MGYIAQLKAHNERIKELTDEVNRFRSNELHLSALEQELCDAEQKLAGLQKCWDALYVPALEKHQQLSSELYMMHYQPEKFAASLMRQLNALSTRQIKQLIVESESQRTCPAVVDAVSPESPCEASSDASKELSFHRSWTLAAAARRLECLEKQHVEITKRRLSLGNRTGELMVALKSFDKKIAALESAMQMPPESFYSSVERKLLPHRLKFYKSYLSARTSSPISISHSDASGISVPSVLSISTDMTDLGSEFLKSTEEGLDKVFASQNLWSEL